MDAASFDQANSTLGPPRGLGEDDVTSLRVWRGSYEDSQPVVISCWKPTRAELDEIERTGRVWLHIWGATMPPALVSGFEPEWKE